MLKTVYKSESQGTWFDIDANNAFDQRYNWCLKNLGPATEYPPRWEPGETGHPLKFRFRDPKDELLFTLKWGLV